MADANLPRKLIAAAGAIKAVRTYASDTRIKFGSICISRELEPAGSSRSTVETPIRVLPSLRNARMLRGWSVDVMEYSTEK